MIITETTIKVSAMIAVVVLMTASSMTWAVERCGSPAAIACSGMGSGKVCTRLTTITGANFAHVQSSMGANCNLRASPAGPFVITLQGASVTMGSFVASGCTTSACFCNFSEYTVAVFNNIDNCVIDGMNDGLPVELMEFKVGE